MESQFLSLAARFPSRDFAATCAFYEPLGFRVIWCEPGVYLILRKDGAELHFTPAPDDLDPATSTQSAYVRVLNAALFARQAQDVALPGSGLPRFVNMLRRPWGMLEAHSVDPDGNLVIYGASEETLGENG